MATFRELLEGIPSFGWEVKRKEQPVERDLPSFSPPQRDDGAAVIEHSVTGGAYGQYIDIDGSSKTEADLITRYRGMALQAEIDMGLQEIVNEAVVMEEHQETVMLNLDEAEDIISDDMKEVIDEEFKEVCRLLEFDTKAYQVFLRWYIDGRLYYHMIIDEKNPDAGILELRYIDPRKIRKVREVKSQRVGQGSAFGSASVMTTMDEYYIYNQAGFQTGARTQGSGATSGLRISLDSVVQVTSGLLDADGRLVISHLHKAIKPLNMLRAEEDAVVIYRLVRAPERLVFYIDTGNLPKMKAEQYMRDMMTKYKNRLVYDSTDGTIRDDRKFMHITENFWLNRREGGKGTEIEQLEGGANLGQMDDVLYFQKRLFRSMNVPLSRLDPDSLYVLGRVGEISRDEANFSKFIDRVRVTFGQLFVRILGKQLIAKRVLSPEDWDRLAPLLRFKWARDNYWAEQKDLSNMMDRMNVMALVMPFVGRYVSHDFVRRQILRQDDEDIRKEDKLIAIEAMNPQFAMVDPETGLAMPNPLQAGPPPPALGPDTGEPAQDPNKPPKQKKPGKGSGGPDTGKDK